MARRAIDRYPSARLDGRIWVSIGCVAYVVCDKEFVAGSDRQRVWTVDPVSEHAQRPVAARCVLSDGTGAFFLPTPRAVCHVEISVRVEGQGGWVANSVMKDAKRTLFAWTKHFDGSVALGARAG